MYTVHHYYIPLSIGFSLSHICCFPSPQLISSLTPPATFPILCVQVIQMFTVAVRFWQQTPYFIQKIAFYSIPPRLLAHIVFLPFLKWVKQIFIFGLCSPYCQYFEEWWVPAWTVTHCWNSHLIFDKCPCHSPQWLYWLKFPK